MQVCRYFKNLKNNNMLKNLYENDLLLEEYVSSLPFVKSADVNCKDGILQVYIDFMTNLTTENIRQLKYITGLFKYYDNGIYGAHLNHDGNVEDLVCYRFKRKNFEPFEYTVWKKSKQYINNIKKKAGNWKHYDDF